MMKRECIFQDRGNQETEEWLNVAFLLRIELCSGFLGNVVSFCIENEKNRALTTPNILPAEERVSIHHHPLVIV